MIHPHTELRAVNADVGVGVFATHFIPRGTLVWVQDARDVIFTAAQLGQLSPEDRALADKYAYVDSRGDLVLCWDIARFMNHRCEPATLSLGEHAEVATRDLYPGDELTCEYGLLNLDQPMRCRCDSPRCRGWIRPEDHGRLGAGWWSTAEALLPAVRRVPQPLWPLLAAFEVDEALLARMHPTRTGTSIMG